MKEGLQGIVQQDTKELLRNKSAESCMGACMFMNDSASEAQTYFCAVPEESHGCRGDVTLLRFIPQKVGGDAHG